MAENTRIDSEGRAYMTSGAAHNARPLLLIAGAVGVSAGLASWAVRRRRSQSKWKQAGRAVNKLVHNVQNETQPWMAVTAGTAAGGAALATYLRRRSSREARWQRIGRQANSMARRAQKGFRPSAEFAASVAIGLLSAVYGPKRPRVPRPEPRARTEDVKRGFFGKVGRIASQSAKLYSGIRTLTA